MKDSKVVSTLRDAIARSGLKNGGRISFHHHLRNGDGVMNMVLAELAAMGYKDLTLNSSSVFDVQSPVIDHIKNGVVTHIETNYMGSRVGRFISEGGMKEPVIFRSHGGRPAAIESGETPIDVAFVAAPTSDCMGNATGRIGKSACGSLGYAEADARCAAHTIVITDNLAPYPVENALIEEQWVDSVVAVDSIGDPAGIVSGTTRITRDPVGLVMAQTCVDVIRASGLLKDGFSFQTGAGGNRLVDGDAADRFAFIEGDEGPAEPRQGDLRHVRAEGLFRRKGTDLPVAVSVFRAFDEPPFGSDPPDRAGFASGNDIENPLGRPGLIGGEDHVAPAFGMDHNPAVRMVVPELGKMPRHELLVDGAEPFPEDDLRAAERFEGVPPQGKFSLFGDLFRRSPGEEGELFEP